MGRGNAKIIPKRRMVEASGRLLKVLEKEGVMCI
jgi:hypothetical protein